MRPTQLSLRDFKSHADTTLDLSSMHIASISGSNGAGKSTILDAIVYAIYGADGLGLGRQSETVIREGADTATVRLDFELAGQRYQIERTRRITGKSTLELRIRSAADTAQAMQPGTVEAWEPITRGTIKETQQQINDIIGSTAETFLQSAFIAQGDAGRFVHGTPAERKATLVQALDLEQYPPLEKAARERARSEQAALDTARARVADLELQAGNVEEQAALVATTSSTLEQLTGTLPALEEKAAASSKAVQDARIAAASTDSARERVRDLAARAASLQQDADRIRLDVERRENEAEMNRAAADQLVTLTSQQPPVVEIDEEKLETLRKELVVATDDVSTCEKEHAGWKQEQALVLQAVRERDEMQRKLEAAVNALAAVNDKPDAHCPTCTQTLDQAARAATLATLTKQHDDLAKLHEAARSNAAMLQQQLDPEQFITNALDEARKRRETIAREFETLTAAHAQARRQNEEHHSYTARIASAKTAQERQATLDESVAGARQQQIEILKTLEAAKTEHDQAVANLAADDNAQRIRALEQQASADTERAESVRRSIAASRDELTRAQTRLEAAQQVAKQLDEARAALAPLEAAHDRWSVLTRAFGRDGIPAQVIKHARPQIEADANDILGRVGAPYRIRLDLERDTKSGTVADTLDVTILAGNHERPFDLLSGGEQERVAIALRVAIGRVLANRSGKRLELLVIDEPSGLDADGFSALADLVKVLGAEFGIVLLVTHGDGFEAACDTSIRVDKIDGASRVQIAA